ncbi:MAG TPA: hypothetical protein VIW29_16110 [Polyangiaceae bacterium]
MKLLGAVESSLSVVGTHATMHYTSRAMRDVAMIRVIVRAAARRLRS